MFVVSCRTYFFEVTHVSFMTLTMIPIHLELLSLKIIKITHT